MKIMRKILATVLTLLLSGAAAQAQGTVIKGYLLVDGEQVVAAYTKLSDNTVMLGTGQNACMSQLIGGHVTVPGEITVGGSTYSVVEVGNLAFRLCNKIVSVEIKENVTRVGDFAFVGCPGIKEITLPASLVSIGTGAFQSCIGSIESVTCLGATPARWEYNDVFKFHDAGIGDNKPELITASVGLYVPDGAVDTYHQANYTNPDLGWTTADGWSSFNNLNLGQDVFHIYTPADLESLRDIVNYGNRYNTIRRTELEKDIDMSAYSWDKGIGYREEEPYLGNFNGNGHTIRNLHVNNSNGSGSLFAHFGGHSINNLTIKDCSFMGNGSTGALVGESGYCDIFNVWVENTRVVGGDYVGGLVGKCLTTGGANVYHSVIKDMELGSYNFLTPSIGGMVGFCYGGKVRNCAVIGNLPDPYYMDLGVLALNDVAPFAASSNGGNDFYVENSYATSDYFEYYDFRSFENIDHDVVVSKKRTFNYVDAGENTVAATYDAETMKSMFMLPELGLDEWIYVPGDYPLPAVFADQIPVDVNKAVYCSTAIANSRVNGLSPSSVNKQRSFLDLTPNGYRSLEYQTSQLWIDENFSYDPNSVPATQPTPYLPIGTATIEASHGVRFDRTIEVTQTGTKPMTVQNAVVDSEGNPVRDEFGDIQFDGTTTTIYNKPVFADAASCIFLPYPLTINDGVKFCQPVQVSLNGQRGLVAMREAATDTSEPWQPYYLVLSDAPVNLSNYSHLVIEPRPYGTDVEFGVNGDFRLHGVARPTAADSPPRYVLSGFNTFVYDDGLAPAWTSFITYANGTSQNDFVVIREVPLFDTGDNDETIEKFNETTVNVCLNDRVFYKDDTWYTLCLPFDVPVLTGTPLEGVTLRTMDDTQFDNGELTINFAEATAIAAGKPYLMKWPRAPKIKNPVFENVTVKNVKPIAVTCGMVRFKGTFSPWMLVGEDKSKLYLGDENRLYYAEEDMVVNSCRAFFELKESIVSSPDLIQHIVLNFDGSDALGIDDINAGTLQYSDDWYTIDGRRLSCKPTERGIYINQGKKILIK